MRTRADGAGEHTGGGGSSATRGTHASRASRQIRRVRSRSQGRGHIHTSQSTSFFVLRVFRPSLSLSFVVRFGYMLVGAMRRDAGLVHEDLESSGEFGGGGAHACMSGAGWARSRTCRSLTTLLVQVCSWTSR